MSTEHPFFADALTPEEAALAGADVPLKSDIESLGKVSQAQAVEAVVFYAGRILEMVANRTMHDLELREHGTVLATLAVLEQFSLMPITTRYCAHALRRLANDARHVLRHLSIGDAELARVLNDVWLRWYFCGFAFGPRVPDRGHCTGEVHEILQACERGEIQHLRDLRDAAAMDHSPVLVGIVIETWLSWGEMDEAHHAITRGLSRFPADLRLQMLHGLLLSRTKKLEAALAVLEPLQASCGQDPDACGILAGAYKRLWHTSGDEKWLRKAFTTYQQGWKNSKHTSSYLGVNAATTALWCGDPIEAEQIARTVRTVMTERITRLSRKIADPLAAMEFWDAVTVAELDLLLGDARAARALYERVFATHTELRSNIDVARGQAAKIARVKALPGFQDW